MAFQTIASTDNPTPPAPTPDSWDDWLAIGKGTLLAMGGAALAYLADQGPMAAAVAAILLNVARKFLLPKLFTSK